MEYVEEINKLRSATSNKQISIINSPEMCLKIIMLITRFLWKRDYQNETGHSNNSGSGLYMSQTVNPFSPMITNVTTLDTIYYAA